jgi:hypothetical protein
MKDESNPPAAKPAAPPEKRKKPKPDGVTVGERSVMVDGKLVPMSAEHQTSVPWK